MRHGVKRIEGTELILVGTGRPCAAQEIGWTRLDCWRTEAHKRAEALIRQWGGRQWDGNMLETCGVRVEMRS